MDSGWLKSRGSGVDPALQTSKEQSDFGSYAGPNSTQSQFGDRVSDAVVRTRDWLLEQQHEDGYWVGELEGDTILESEYILLLTFLGRGQSDAARRAANYIEEKQLSSGGWAIYPGGPLEISASVKAYLALKIVGHSSDEELMVRAKRAILEAGGAERVNSFTRFYLALLGQLGYDQCPAVPPELILIPRWMPFNIYEMSAWSRTIIVPLSLMWAHRPTFELPLEMGIRELFADSPEELSASMGPAETVDALKRKTWINWTTFFNGVDRFLKLLDRCRIRPFRRLAVRRAKEWMLQRFDDSDGLGAIFPPIVWSVVALKCLGYDDESAEVRSAMSELETLVISDGDTDRLQPCKSPVWDTAIATIALREAGVPCDDPAMKRSADWLLSKEVRQPGDWAELNRGHEPSGWFFEFNNKFYPDVDDTVMVVMALHRCLPEDQWSIEFLLDDWSPHEIDRDVAAVVAGKTKKTTMAQGTIASMQPLLSAVHRGARWLLAFQGRDGGWGAFDPNNDRELFTRVPFADHNAMIDPSTADITARILEMFGMLEVPADHPAIARAVDFVWNDQEPDHCWYGRWGVNYLYGTWQVIVGLTSIGVDPDDPRIQMAVGWLQRVQQDCGGWGETARSYDEPGLRGQGPVTASQTAWALMGLMAAGETDSASVRRGVACLLDSQQTDGTWIEDWFTGTGFPRVFYLKYHLYRIYFPLMALARYARLAEPVGDRAD